PADAPGATENGVSGCSGKDLVGPGIFPPNTMDVNVSRGVCAIIPTRRIRPTHQSVYQTAGGVRLIPTQASCFGSHHRADVRPFLVPTDPVKNPQKFLHHNAFVGWRHV